MEENVVVHILGVVVTDDAQETDLVVDDEQSCIVLVNPLELVRSTWVDIKSPSALTRREQEHREPTVQDSEEQTGQEDSHHFCSFEVVKMIFESTGREKRRGLVGASGSRLPRFYAPP